eukprot:2427305-Rhodomonas_salina.1
MTPFNSVSHGLGLLLLVPGPRVHCYETLPKSALLQLAHSIVCETLPFRTGSGSGGWHGYHLLLRQVLQLPVREVWPTGTNKHVPRPSNFSWSTSLLGTITRFSTSMLPVLTMHFPVPCYPGQWMLKTILFAAEILLCAQQEGSLQNANCRSCAGDDHRYTATLRRP